MANAAPKPPQQRRPNYAAIYANPLPLQTYPLPAFIPNNPLSFLRLAYAIVSQFLFPPSSHASHTAYYDEATYSVHVTDPVAVRALWEQGFFGKGSLSRSEPEWLEREKRRLANLGGANGGITSGEWTNKRRDERREQKRERARLEREAVEEQLRKEGKLPALNGEAKGSLGGEGKENMPGHEAAQNDNDEGNIAYLELSNDQGNTVLVEGVNGSLSKNLPEKIQEKGPRAIDIHSHAPIINQEHLQLTPVEAFFLVYALGAITIVDHMKGKAMPTESLFSLFRSISYFPPAEVLRPDDPFLVSYVVYHHFRSLGWVVRSGIKFACDYLLYARGPVFAHAEFAVLMVPSYGHADLGKDGGNGSTEQKDWYWLHCVNRVQTQVRKTLVLAYVDIPESIEFEHGETGELDIGKILKKYRVREFIFKRWSPNRNRD